LTFLWSALAVAAAVRKVDKIRQELAAAEALVGTSKPTYHDQLELTQLMSVQLVVLVALAAVCLMEE
jgi:hypothetical protein